jgi:hypothetical protein
MAISQRPRNRIGRNGATAPIETRREHRISPALTEKRHQKRGPDIDPAFGNRPHHLLCHQRVDDGDDQQHHAPRQIGRQRPLLVHTLNPFPSHI